MHRHAARPAPESPHPGAVWWPLPETGRSDGSWGRQPQPLNDARFHALRRALEAHAGQRTLFMQGVRLGARPELGLTARLITSSEDHQRFFREACAPLADGETPEFTLLDVPDAPPAIFLDSLGVAGAAILDDHRRLVLVGGAPDPGALRAALRAAMRGRLARAGALALNAAASVGPGGDVAVLLGPPGSGKTTLIADSQRRIIADDGLGWDGEGVFDLEGVTGRAGHPAAVVLLLADPCAVLPPVALPTPHQASFLYLSGYGARPRDPGTPTGAFWPCGGAPLATPDVHAEAHLWGDHIARHGPRLYLINTGWLGGPPGVGQRVILGHTRAMVRAALTGALDAAPTRRDPVFGLQVPGHVSGVPDALLQPRGLWTLGAEHDAQAQALVHALREHFRAFAGDVSPAVRAAVPLEVRA